MPAKFVPNLWKISQTYRWIYRNFDNGFLENLTVLCTPWSILHSAHMWSRSGLEPQYYANSKPYSIRGLSIGRFDSRRQCRSSILWPLPIKMHKQGCMWCSRNIRLQNAHMPQHLMSQIWHNLPEPGWSEASLPWHLWQNRTTFSRRVNHAKLLHKILRKNSPG